MDSKGDTFVIVLEVKRENLLSFWFQNLEELMGRHKLKGYWDSMDSNFWRRMYEELADSSSDISDDNMMHAFVDVLCKIYTCRNTDNMLKTAVFYKLNSLIIHLLETRRSIISTTTLRSCLKDICSRKSDDELALLKVFMDHNVCKWKHLGCHPLEIAMETGNEKAFNMFKQLPPDADENKNVLLMTAAKYGFLPGLKWLLADCIQNGVDSGYLLLLFCNSKHNCEGEKHLPTLRFLLDHIDYSQQDLDDATVRVIENGCFKDVKPTVKLLLQKEDSADIHSISGHETRT